MNSIFKLRKVNKSAEFTSSSFLGSYVEDMHESIKKKYQETLKKAGADL